MNENRFLTAALNMARDGIPVFPCWPRTKEPITEHGFKDATTDESVIRQWWEMYPDANVAIPTGDRSGRIVLDVDMDKDKDGETALAQVISQHQPLPDTLVARTPRGGRHLCFRHPGQKVPSRTDHPAPALDVRGDGGYVLIPPSQTDRGTYSYLNKAAPAECPCWLIDILVNGNGQTENLPTVAPSPARSRQHEPFDEEGRIHAALRFILASDYDTWTKVGMALHTWDPHRGLSVWDDWSRSCPEKYDERQPPKKWLSFKTNRTNGVTLGTLFELAKRGGWVPSSASILRGGVNKPVPATPAEWPDPQPIPDELVPVMAFVYDLLPAALRTWIRDIAERLQCPPDFSAVAVMVAIASVVGRCIGIRPKRHDDWLVVPNLWGAVIGRAGVMKSPAIAEPLKPLKRLEIEDAKQYKAERSEYEAKQLLAKQRRAIAEASIKGALKDSGGEAAAMDIARQALQEDGCEPTRKRHLVNDSTVEKHGELLRQNPNGYCVYRDELVGLLKSLDKDGQEGARAFYLEAWNGTGRYTFDRIGRGTIDIESVIFSIIGGITPGPLGDYLRQAVQEGALDDGLMQRFQLAVWPDISREWRNVDRWPDGEAKRSAYAAFERLARLDPQSVGARVDENDEDGIPYLHFTESGQVLFDEWREGLEAKIRTGDEHPALESHLSKYRSLIPSLALLIHLVDDGQGGVTKDALQRAIGWGEYLESHARRIFAVAISPDIPAAKALAKRLQNGDLKEEFSLKDIYRPCWSGLNTRELAQAAVDVLLDLEWLAERRETAPGAFKPSTIYQLNPKVGNTPRQVTAFTAVGSNGSNGSSLPSDLPSCTEVSQAASPTMTAGPKTDTSLVEEEVV